MGCNPLEGLKDCLDGVLGLRDELGLTKAPVFILTRTWSGQRVGDGTAVDSLKQVLPSPYIVDLAHDLRLREGGMIKQGDLILKAISKNLYPLESDIDCTSTSRKIERFYLVGDKIYNVIHVKNNYVTWEVHIRKISNQRRY